MKYYPRPSRAVAVIDRIHETEPDPSRYGPDRPWPEREAGAPRTRAECPLERPCPWVGCRSHLYLSTAIDGPGGGHRTILDALRSPRPPDILPAPESLPESCALDIAERGEQTLEQIAEHLGGISRERVRQVQEGALWKVAKRANGDDTFRMDPDPRPIRASLRRMRQSTAKRGTP